MSGQPEFQKSLTQQRGIFALRLRLRLRLRLMLPLRPEECWYVLQGGHNCIEGYFDDSQTGVGEM